MKKINFIKIVLDIVMVVVFALLFNKMVFGGMTFHEVAGTAIGAAFIIHMGLNWRWIKQVTLKIFSNKISIKTRIGYIVDMLLLIAMVITIISGIAISKVVFTGINLGNSMFFKTAHTSVPYIALILLGVHLALHWTWVMNVFKKILKITPGKKSLNYIAKAAVVLVLAFGIYSIQTTNFISKVSSVTRIFSTAQLTDGEMKGGFPGDKAVKQIPNGGDGSFQGKEGMNNGQRPDRAEGKGEMGGSVNPLKVIASYLGIVAVFTIIPYYIEKLLMLRKSKGNIKVIIS